jgi:hypothetical protein
VIHLKKKKRGAVLLHGLPVEIALILDTSPIRQFREIDFRQQGLQVWEKLMKGGCLGRQGSKEESRGCHVAGEILALVVAFRLHVFERCCVGTLTVLTLTTLISS